MTSRGRPRNFDRTEALTAAMLLFWEKGYTATSMADLYRVMGISSPSLYAAFGSKEDLYLAAIEHYAQQIAPHIWQPLEAAPTAREAVEAWLIRSAETLTRDGFPPGCMVTLSGVASEGNDRLGEVVIRSRYQGLQLLTARLKRGVATGELPPETDVATLARLYVSLQQGMSLQARDGAGSKVLKQVARLAMHLWPETASQEECRTFPENLRA
ncbi:TetR/AcrR family transcriptional regulator [Erwinia sp. P6884]|uniref:TetR/AcrR family transcriptional regulator n=1 Tax=Erwinia sp. P6884 TaxID=3141450 RepID=UPI00318E5AE0